MTVQFAGIVALGGTEPCESRLDAMLDAMNPRGRSAARACGRQDAAIFGVLAIPRGGADAEPPTLLAENGGLFAADVSIWDRATAGPAQGAGDDVRRLAGLIRHSGAEATADLHGDFAWALWDGRVLTLGRDHFGARPLYYTVRPGHWIAFASHPGALLAAGLARPALHFPSLLHCGTWDTPRPGHYYQADIAVVRPAHVVRIGRDARVEPRRIWRLPIGPRLPARTDPAEIRAEIRRLLEQAVRRRLPAAGAAGGHLSGGIDSTPIAVIAARAIRGEGRRFFGYSLEESFDDLDFEPVDEASYVAEVVTAEPNIAHVPVPEPSCIAPLVGAYDTALLQPAAEPEHQILAHAEAHGLGTLMSGWGGDQIVSHDTGHWLPELLLHGRWGWLMDEMRGFDAPLRAVLYYRLLLPLLRRRWRRWLTRLTGRGLPDVDFRPLMRRAHLPQRDPPEQPFPAPGSSFLGRREMAERNFIQQRLAHFAHLGAPYGVSYAYPLLDLDLVRFAMRVPAYFLARRGTSRCLMRDAIEGLLPERVRLRELKLFPHSRDTLRMPELRERIDARLAGIPADGLAARLVDVAGLRAELRRLLPAPEVVREQLRAHAARGEQYYLEAFSYMRVIRLVVGLDEYERRYGAAALEPDAAPGAPGDPAGPRAHDLAGAARSALAPGR